MLAGGRRRRGFRDAIRATGARLVPIGPRVALEAAEVATLSARKDPGDGFLIATARVRSVPKVTRDAEMIALAREGPEYLSVVEVLRGEGYRVPEFPEFPGQRRPRRASSVS